MVEGVRESLGYSFNLLDTHGISSFGTGVDEENGFRSSISIRQMPSASVTNGLSGGTRYPEPEKGGRGKKKTVEISSTFSRKRLQQARRVLHHSRELALAVLCDTTTSLDDALNKVHAEQKTRESEEEKLAAAFGDQFERRNSAKARAKSNAFSDFVVTDQAA
jgi:hypothetical protein